MLKCVIQLVRLINHRLYWRNILLNTSPRRCLFLHHRILCVVKLFFKTHEGVPECRYHPLESTHEVTQLYQLGLIQVWHHLGHSKVIPILFRLCHLRQLDYIYVYGVYCSVSVAFLEVEARDHCALPTLHLLIIINS